jgi:hypothetical protein
MSRGTCTSHFMDDVCCQFPHSLLAPFSLLLTLTTLHPGNPPLMLAVRIFVHTRPWLVINCPSPSLNSPPLLLLTVPYSSHYMFSKTTSQHQVHSLIQEGWAWIPALKGMKQHHTQTILKYFNGRKADCFEGHWDEIETEQ